MAPARGSRASVLGAALPPRPHCHPVFVQETLGALTALEATTLPSYRTAVTPKGPPQPCGCLRVPFPHRRPQGGPHLGGRGQAWRAPCRRAPGCAPHLGAAPHGSVARVGGGPQADGARPRLPSSGHLGMSSSHVLTGTGLVQTTCPESEAGPGAIAAHVSPSPHGSGPA